MSGLPLRIGMLAGCVVVVSFLAIGVLGLLGAVCYLSLRDVATPPLAALLTASAGIVAIVVIAAIARLAMPKTQHAPAPSSTDTSEHLLANLGGILGMEMARFARARPYETLAGSLVAGFALGACPRLRDHLWRALRGN